MTPTATPTPALAPVLRLLWLMEALVGADVEDALVEDALLEGPEGVWLAVGLVMR